MTDFNDDKQKSHKKSFKEQILADLEEANRLRKKREAELQQKEIEAKEAAENTARLLAKYEAEKLKEEQEKKALAEKAALAKKAQEVLQQKALQEKLKAEQNKKDLEEQHQLEAIREQEYQQNQEQLDNNKVYTEIVDKHADPDTLIVNQVSDPKGETSEIFAITDDSNIVRSSEGLEVAKEIVSLTNQVDADEMIATEDKIEPHTEKLDTRKAKKVKTNKLAKRISLYLITGIILLCLVAGVLGVTYVSSALKPVDKNDNSYVQVEIPSGSGNKLIGRILQKSGVIKNAQVFNFYSKFKNYTNFQSGYYNLQKSMSLDDIATELQKGGTAEPTKPALGKILITEGYTIKQIASAIEKNSAAKSKASTPFKASAFLKLVQNQDFIDKMVAKYPNLLGSLPDKSSVKYQLEGYLFPATYNYYKETTLEELVEDMISTMDTNLSSLYSKIASKNMTVNEVLSMASLLEKEGSTDDDRRNISSVFYNRLDSGMPLQSNIAILYAMDKLGEKTTLAEDATVNTEIDSPFNIYVNTGLTPGPVDSPSLSAIKAAVSPASTDYLYFVADVKTGKVYYSQSYEEHNENVEKYINSQIN